MAGAVGATYHRATCASGARESECRRPREFHARTTRSVAVTWSRAAMSADATPVVTLFGPALDVGAPVPVPGAPVASPGAGEPLGDTLAALVADAGGASLERRPREPLPWEARLMIALGLLPADTGAGARSAVPLARLVGDADLPSTGGHRVVADFVSLSPGRDEATLAPTEALDLKPTESAALAAAANALLAADGIAFVRGRSGRWYLEGLAAAGLDTAPAHFLARREIGEHWPASAEAAPWRRLMAEIEMLWHAHPVNEAREARGAPPVNGVWFWGGAAPPPAIRPVGTAVATVLADDPFARVLAAHAGAVVLPVATPFDEALAGCAGDALLVVDLGPYSAWLGNDGEALDAARANSLASLVRPALAAVATGRASAVTLLGDAGEAHVGAPPPRGWVARLFGRETRRASP